MRCICEGRSLALNNFHSWFEKMEIHHSKAIALRLTSSIRILSMVCISFSTSLINALVTVSSPINIWVIRTSSCRGLGVPVVSLIIVFRLSMNRVILLIMIGMILLRKILFLSLTRILSILGLFRKVILRGIVERIILITISILIAVLIIFTLFVIVLIIVLIIVIIIIFIHWLRAFLNILSRLWNFWISWRWFFTHRLVWWLKFWLGLLSEFSTWSISLNSSSNIWVMRMRTVCGQCSLLKLT